MLKPIIISKQETNNILDIISILAKEDITPNNKIINFLNKSNIYQYQLPELKNTKIVLSKKVYKQLIKLAKYSNKYEEEFGCYLFGYKELNTIYYTSLSKHKPKKHINTFKTTPSMQNEITKNMSNKNINYICHVHTHSFNINTYSNTPSNEDLYLYAWLQEQLGNKDNTFMGALITPPDYDKISFNDLCFIIYNKNKFYKITNIYYLDNDKEIPLNKININIGHIEKRPVLLNIN